jgi:polar amino acid transport system ATP-binding protein
VSEGDAGLARGDTDAARPGSEEPSEPWAPSDGDAGLLRIENLRKCYGPAVVLRDLSLDVPAHRCVVLIGASGSGKSTLLRCINLLEIVDDGRIFLQGKDITDPRVDGDAIRSQVGIVFQSFNLFPHMSVLDNITLAPRRVHGIGRRTAESDAMAMLERVGLADKARARPDELSGGQQQRVAIARALVNKPVLMLFDEVTSALDPELVGEVLELLAELKADGMTMLVATHEMGFARQVADQVVFLEGGEIAEAGPPERVLTSPTDPRTQRFLRRIIDAGRL